MEKIAYPIRVKSDDLRLADVVRLFDGPFGWAIVMKIDEGGVHFYRPYAVTEGFSYTGGVLAYVGIEQFSRPRSEDCEYEVFQRKELT